MLMLYHDHKRESKIKHLNGFVIISVSLNATAGVLFNNVCYVALSPQVRHIGQFCREFPRMPPLEHHFECASMPHGLHTPQLPAKVPHKVSPPETLLQWLVTDLRSKLNINCLKMIHS